MSEEGIFSLVAGKVGIVLDVFGWKDNFFDLSQSMDMIVQTTEILMPVSIVENCGINRFPGFDHTQK